MKTLTLEITKEELEKRIHSALEGAVNNPDLKDGACKSKIFQSLYF